VVKWRSIRQVESILDPKRAPRYTTGQVERVEGPASDMKGKFVMAIPSMVAPRWVGWLVVASSGLSAIGAEPLSAPKGYVCGRVSNPVVVDGSLDDPAWSSAPWTSDFVDIEGDKKPIPRFRTRVKMAWDLDYLYIAAELLEPHVWGNLTKHDSVIFQDNDFEVFLDPDGDNHKYFEVEINALGTEWDLYLPKPYRDGGSADNSWEIPGLKKAVKVQGTINNSTDVDTGWTVELAIPWKDLALDGRLPGAPKDGDQWRVNFSRVEWETRVEGSKYVKVEGKPEANWVWSPQGLIDMHQPEHWGYLQFSKEAPGVAKYRIDPSGGVRDRLMTIYHAQKAFHKAAGGWSGSIEALGLKPDDLKVPGATPPMARLTPTGFEASMTTAPGDGRPARTWMVDQGSRLTSKP